jgi:hypothetical protein
LLFLDVHFGESWRIKHSSSCVALTLALTPVAPLLSHHLTLAHPPHHLRWVSRSRASRDSASMNDLAFDLFHHSRRVYHPGHAMLNTVSVRFYIKIRGGWRG